VRGDRDLGNVLRKCRERAGLTQEQLARQIYVDRTVIAKVETGALNPSYVLVKDWARVTDSVHIIQTDLDGTGTMIEKQRQMDDAINTVKAALSRISFMRIRVKK
jgi:transcriptional regulator with XRE-family HTH domain